MHCLQSVQNYLENEDTSLITNFSMTALGLSFLKHELIANKRTHILELGSGLSTVFMARLIKKEGLSARILSVEHDPAWANKIVDHIKAVGLQDLIDIKLVPLVENPAASKGNKWYDRSLLTSKLEESAMFDLIIVDGPPAYHPAIELSRYGALPFFINKMAKESVIVLDDAGRPGEQKVLHLWKKEFGAEFRILNNRLAVYRKGLLSLEFPQHEGCI